jgi:hypothetical protein
MQSINAGNRELDRWSVQIDQKPKEEKPRRSGAKWVVRLTAAAYPDGGRGQSCSTMGLSIFLPCVFPAPKLIASSFGGGSVRPGLTPSGPIEVEWLDLV